MLGPTVVRRDRYPWRRRGTGNPACLPEQLLCSADGSPVRAERQHRRLRPGANARRSSSAKASSPAFASMRVTPSTCASSPPCEAQANASSSSPKPVRIRRAGLDQRQSLQRLDRGTRENRRRHVGQRPARSRHRHRQPRQRRDDGSRADGPRKTSTRIGLFIFPDYSSLMCFFDVFYSSPTLPRSAGLRRRHEVRTGKRSASALQ